MNSQLMTMHESLSLRDKVRLVEIAHQTKDSEIKKHALMLLAADHVSIQMPPIEISIGDWNER